VVPITSAYRTNTTPLRQGIWTMTTTDAISKLEAAGAIKAKMEDSSGKTRAGWWLDGVYLAPVADPKAAWAAING